MKALTAIVYVLFSTSGVGFLYLVFQPTFNTVQKLVFIYIVFICVFVLVLNYRASKGIF